MYSLANSPMTGTSKTRIFPKKNGENKVDPIPKE
jgi:hypothetical protein